MLRQGNVLLCVEGFHKWGTQYDSQYCIALDGGTPERGRAFAETAIEVSSLF